jgi:hypothetical protein
MVPAITQNKPEPGSRAICLNYVSDPIAPLAQKARAHHFCWFAQAGWPLFPQHVAVVQPSREWHVTPDWGGCHSRRFKEMAMTVIIIAATAAIEFVLYRRGFIRGFF